MKFIQIADSYLTVSDNLDLLSNAVNYLPFQINSEAATADFLFHFFVDTSLSFPERLALSVYSNENGRYTVFYHDGIYYWQLQRGEDHDTYCMMLDLQTKKASINFHVSDANTYYAANDFLRFAFIYASAAFDTLLLHASGVTYEGRGIAFVGRSGIGKSTHSSLWLQFVSGAELLNDDQPAVRVRNGAAIIYGTPWSGKTPCYRPAQVPLKAILCMKQAKENKLIPLERTVLFSRMLSSCSLMKSDRNTLPNILNTLSNITGCVRGAVLENRPDQEAVWISFRFLKEL